MNTYKSKLQASNTNLQEILDAVNALPEAGSGGNSFETCTVRIDVVTAHLYGYCATCFENGNIVTKSSLPDTSNGTFIIDNVICGKDFALIFTIRNGAPLINNGEFITYWNQCGAIITASNSQGTTTLVQLGQYSQGGDE